MSLTDALTFLGILLTSGLFSGTETALTAVSPIVLHKLSEEGDGRARILERLLADKGRVIAALLVGNNIVNVVLAVYATVVFDGMLQGSDLFPESMSGWAGPLLASVMSVLFLLVFGEVMPKTIAVAFRKRWALLSAWPVWALMHLLRPVTYLLARLSRFVMILLGHRDDDESIFDVGGIQALARMSEAVGAIDSLEGQLVHRAAELNDTRVREIMIPRTDIVGVRTGTTYHELRELFRQTPFSRLPVFEDDLDNIQGVLNFKEFLRTSPKNADSFDLHANLHKPLYVPETMFIGDLLEKMKEQRSHLAIVIDEYGGTSGMVTLEDVVERLVGRIEDEYDNVREPVVQLADDLWRVDGRVPDEQLFEEIDIELVGEAAEGFDTAGGLVLKAFGNIPTNGDVISYHGMELTVERVKGHRVRSLLVRKQTPDEIESGQSTRMAGVETTDPMNDGTSVRKAYDGLNGANTETTDE